MPACRPTAANADRQVSASTCDTPPPLLSLPLPPCCPAADLELAAPDLMLGGDAAAGGEGLPEG